MQLVVSYFLKVLRAVPPRLSYKVLYRILLLSRYRKQVINNNFTKTNISSYYPSSFNAFYKDNIKFISRLIVETLHLSSAATKIDLAMTGMEQIEKLTKSKGGLILLASHAGNWEIACSHLPRFIDVKVVGVYKPLKNKAIDKRVRENRSRYGLELVPMASIARTMIDYHQSGIAAIYILIADQNPRSRNNVSWQHFLGVKTAFDIGAQKLSQRFGYDTAYMKVVPESSLFSYKIDFVTHDQLVETGDLISGYAHVLEEQLKHEPTSWLWSHKRWKRTEGFYP